MFHRQEKKKKLLSTGDWVAAEMTGSKIQVYSIGQKLNSIGRQYKAKEGLLFMYSGYEMDEKWAFTGFTSQPSMRIQAELRSFQVAVDTLFS